MTKLITVTVGPLAAASATNIAASQTLKGANAFALTGALTSGSSANNIATAHSYGGAGNLTLDGSLVSSGVAYLPGAKSVQIISSGDDSANTFTVYGYGYGAPGGGATSPVGVNSSGPVALVETVAGTNASRVATRTTFYQVYKVTISGASGGNVTVGTNGVATLDKPRRILFTSGGDDSGITFTVNGTDWNGLPISEVKTGANGTTYTNYDFATVTGIWPSGATASTVTIGTNSIASSRPIFPDIFVNAPTSLQVDVTGTVNYSVQQSLNNPLDVGYTSVNWLNHADGAVVNSIASAQSEYGYIPIVTRILLNSGTGSVKYSVLQASSVVVS